MKVRVLSAMMGSGKTTKLINEIRDMPMDTKIVYITPLLSECHRIAGTYCLEDDELQRPVISVADDDGNSEYDYKDKDWPLVNRRFRHPVLCKGGNKMDTLLVQIESGCNVTATHSLFRNVNQKLIDTIRMQGYILVLDEVLSVYEEFDDLKIEEMHRLISDGFLFVDKDGMTLRWRRDRFSAVDTRYSNLADLCDVGQLSVIDGKVVIWEFPVEALKAFKEVHIATYLFDGSPMCAYLKTHGFDVVVEKFGNTPKDIAHLVSIVQDNKLNNVGEYRTALSQSDLCLKKNNLDDLRKNLNTFFKSRNKTQIKDRLWTTYKSVSRQISGGRYASSWLYCGAKATNEWATTSHVAYLVNIHLRPMLVKLMAAKGYVIDQDLFAVSEMAQFIWRSRIRNGESIVVYVPSSRMRNLLQNWLNGTYD